jgi:WD40 repeat protein
LNEGFGGTPQPARETRALPTHLRTLVHQLKGDLDWIVMKCLEKDRTRRYETANGLAADLKRHLNNEPVVARPPSKLYEFQKTVRRHKVGFAATAAIIVVLAVGVTVSTWQAARATRARIAADASRQDAQANEAKARSAEASAAAQRDLAQDRLLDSLIREMRSTANLRPAGYRSILRERVHQSMELPRSSQRRDELRAEFTQALGDPIGLDPVLIRWETNQPRVFRMALTSDGELAAIWTDEGGLEIRETATGKRLAKLELEEPLGDLAFSPHGRTLFGRVLDSNSPVAQLHEWRHGSGGSWTPRVHGAVVVSRFLRTPKAVFALVRKAPSEFELVNLETQETLTALHLGSGRLPRVLAVSDDGWIARGVENDVNRNSAVIEVWRPDNAKPRVRLDNLPGMGSLVGAGFSPDGRLLVCAGESGLVVYEIPGFTIIKKHFVYLGTTPYPPAFVGDGSIVAVSLYQQSGIRLLDLTSQTDTHINTPEAMQWLTASMDGTTLAGINQKGISFFRLTDTPERRRLAGHLGGVPAVEFSPDGRLIASTGKDGTIRFWEADSGNSWRVLRQENAVGQSVAFSPDGRWLASADYSHDQLSIWSVKTGTQALRLGQLQRGSGRMWGCGFSPDGRHLVGVGQNGLRIWKISDAATNNGLEAELIVEQPGAFRNLLFDPRRPTIAFSGFIDRGGGWRAFVRGLGPKDELKSVGTGTSMLVQAIGMTPDTGELILSDPYTDRRTLHFWNPDTRTEIRTIPALMPEEAQTGGAWNLRVSPDGKKLAIANHTGRRVNIHDVATGRRLYSLPDEPGVIWWLAWHPDSRRLAVSRDHGDISIWKLDAVEAALAEVGLTP